MKTTTKRFLSILLSVFMLFGTVAMMIPAMVVTASADDYTNVTPNTDFVYNGVTYRLDVYSGNTESYAHINADGTVEFKIRHGDMIWFPDVQLTATSAVHAEVRAISSMDSFFSGFTYGVKPAAAGEHWATAMGAVVCTGDRKGANNSVRSRTRVTAGSYAGLGNVSGGDRGNGGDQRVEAGHWANNITQWGNISTSSGNWAAGKIVAFDLTKSDNTVTVTFGSDWGTYDTISYDTTGHATYAYAGGSVGFAPFWAGNDNYITLRFEDVTVSDCTVNGAARSSYSVVSRKKIAAAQDNMMNEINARYFRGNSHAQSAAKISADGTVKIRAWRGDMLWFPNVQIDDQSVIHSEILFMDKSGSTNNACICPVWNIQTATPGVWGADSDSCSIAALRPASGNNPRVTVGATTKTKSYQSGDYSEAYHDVYNATWATYEANADFGMSWTKGKTLIVDISKTGDTVTATFKNGTNNTLIVEKTYDDSTRNTYRGAVGIMSNWDDGENEYLIKSFTVTNALVNGERRNFNMVSEFASYMSDDFTVRQSLSLDGTIGLNFRLDANFHIPANATLVFSKNGEELYNGVASRYYCDDLGYYRYSVPVFAKEMADSATYNLKIKDGETVVFDQNYSASVKSYAQALAAADAEWADLMNAMLDYGAAAQELFGYNTENLAADISGGITYDVAGLPDLTTDGDRSFLSVIAGTLTLESGTDLNLYFKPVDPGATLTATAEDQSHNAVTLETETVDGFLKVSIKDLAAEELGDEFYITVTDGAKSVTLNYSALCWVKSAVGSASASDETKTLAKAVGVYASEAQKKNQ